MNGLFESLAILHVLVWVFVVFAFLNPKTAALNLYYIIPLIYIVHMLPFHIFGELKKKMRPDTWERDDKEVANSLLLPRIHDYIATMSRNCFGSPVSPQGLLIFGAVTSAWALKR